MQEILSENEQLLKFNQDLMDMNVKLSVEVDRLKREIEGLRQENERLKKGPAEPFLDACIKEASNLFQKKGLLGADFEAFPGYLKDLGSFLSQRCPALFSFISRFASSEGKAIGITCQLLFAHNEKLNHLQKLLGVILISNGAGKKVLTILNHLAISTSDDTTWEFLTANAEAQERELVSLIQSESPRVILDNINLSFSSRFQRLMRDQKESRFDGTLVIFFFPQRGEIATPPSCEGILVSEDELKALQTFLEGVLGKLELERKGKSEKKQEKKRKKRRLREQ